LTIQLLHATSCAQLSVRHIEPGSIGYHDGYTTGEALVFPRSDTNQWIWPLVNLRAHQFNNNAQAGNAGVGARFASENTKSVFGCHAFYDYRNTPRHFNYHQIGLGFEWIGKRFDVRLNGYLPVGKKHHMLFRCDFDEFVDFPSLKRVEVALRGVNLEVGAVLKKIHSTILYAAIGPYFFGGNVCHHPVGGKFRFNATFKKYLFVEGSISYDQVFKTRAQGLVGLKFPIGCKSKASRSSKRSFPLEMLTRPVERFEIIVLDKNCWWRR
jgi:hypothetical protein